MAGNVALVRESAWAVGGTSPRRVTRSTTAPPCGSTTDLTRSTSASRTQPGNTRQRPRCMADASHASSDASPSRRSSLPDAASSSGSTGSKERSGVTGITCGDESGCPMRPTTPRCRCRWRAGELATRWIRLEDAEVGDFGEGAAGACERGDHGDAPHRRRPQVKLPRHRAPPSGDAGRPAASIAAPTRQRSTSSSARIATTVSRGTGRTSRSARRR